MTYVVLGGALLWFGWFGFNAGSAWAANGLAVNALLVTNTAAAAASLTWLFIGWLHKGAPSVVGAVSGAVAGLVAITPASGYVDVSGALAIGLAAGSICYGAILLRERLQVDDALDVWAVHGVGGTTGAILTGVFASTAVNPVVNGGGLLESGNPDLLVTQVIAVGATWIFSGAMTLAILKVVDLVFRVRVRAGRTSSPASTAPSTARWPTSRPERGRGAVRRPPASARRSASGAAPSTRIA